MNVRIEKVGPLRVAFVPNTGPYMTCGQAWGKLMAWAGPRGLMGPNTRVMGMAYDDPDEVPAEQLRYDACITVGPDVKGEGEVGVRDMPAGEYAIATLKGPYEKLKQTYELLINDWLPKSGRSLGPPPCIEFYLNDASTTPPEELLTDVCVPLI